MTRVIEIFTMIIVVAIQNINCAPSNSEEIKETHDEPKLNDIPYSTFESGGVDDNKETQGQRQKRWFENVPYNYYPPPFSRPYNEHSEIDNSLSYIQMRLQEILNIVRSPPPPSPPSLYPVFVPIYIPQISCGCNSVNNDGKLPTTTTKPEQTTNININPPQNATVPPLHERFPETEDERQIWGILINNSIDINDDDDGSRPISLTPILTSSDNERPAPPVEHGSNQADINAETQPTTTVTPQKVVPALEISSKTNVCDRAVLRCCLGPDPTYKCIQSGGCQERSLINDPCNPPYLLSVINRVHSYYKNIN